ncbi:ATP-binding protein [Delftia acidovorans]|uniref:sensor histidine kinase n=1 Tax=Delftia acidovorans TaxID=80866 RepID=UPI0028EEC54C|nr:ATP-binding protein [Delftia acidovorans]
MKAAACLRRAWRAGAEPSLIRRLVLAQAVVLVVVWIALGALLMVEFQSDASELDPLRHDAVLAVAGPLLDRPAALQEALARIDLARRTEGQLPDQPRWRVNMMVWHGPQLLFASPGLSAPIVQTVTDRIETVTAAGERWRAMTRSEASGQLRVTLAISNEPGRGMLTLASSSLLVLPLLISAPLLVFPAWAAVWLALRPWRRLSAEIARRGMGDLAPLGFQPRHRELKPLAHSVNRLLQSVRDGLARERSFIADAAHELRTPVAAIRVHAEALNNLHLPAGLADRLGARLDALVGCSARASRLVDQMLALMRADASPSAPGMQSLEIDRLLQQRLGCLAGLARERGVELDLDAEGPLPLWAERQAMESLIDNLVDNAIKYSPPGGLVRVRARRDAATQATVLEVMDEGPGIAPAWRSRVFDRFFRAPDQAVAGSGLGLAIVAAVVRQHGGAIVCDDADDGPGLCMRVSFPGGAAPH